MLFACDATNCHYLCNASPEQNNFKHAKTNNSLNVDYPSKPGSCMSSLRKEAMNPLMGTQSTAAPGDSLSLSEISMQLDTSTRSSPVHRLGLRQRPVYRDVQWSVDGSVDNCGSTSIGGLSHRAAQSNRARSVPRIHPAQPNPHGNEDTLSCIAAEGDTVPLDEIKGHVRQIFQACSPSKVLEVDYLFRKYEGLERELYARICKKYRVPPKAAYLPRESQEEQDADGHRRKARCVPATTPTDNARLAGFLSDEGFRGVNAHRVKLPVEWCYPLHVAVAMNDAYLARLLLAARGDPSLGDSAGMTPLHLAKDICSGESGAAVREALGG